jgi:hypothetical protein
MESVNWLNRAGFFFGVWVISMGGQWSRDFSGLSLILIPTSQLGDVASVVYSIQSIVWLYTIGMLSACGYSLFRYSLIRFRSLKK